MDEVGQLRDGHVGGERNSAFVKGCRALRVDDTAGRRFQILGGGFVGFNGGLLGGFLVRLLSRFRIDRRLSGGFVGFNGELLGRFLNRFRIDRRLSGRLCRAPALVDEERHQNLQRVIVRDLDVALAVDGDASAYAVCAGGNTGVGHRRAQQFV